MSTPMPDPAPSGEEVRRLVRGVRDLANEVKALADQQAADRGQQRRDRRRTWIVALGLTADLILSGLFVYQHVQQSCTNHRSQQFFTAEVRKVTGQVAGLNELHTDPRAGVEQFKRASKNYLDAIGQLQGKC